jgi:hypothetical protein
MKKPHYASKDMRIRKSACTVSAAALMLGVSHAATVGFNFQTHYCAAASYNGAVVTAPAFGIPTNGWQSLTMMDTGYGCTAGYYTLNETVDTTTSSGGLNPLPNGSLALQWSGYTANVSGFGGYSRSGPHYTFGGNGYKPGNEQVYWGFIRDGVNFGPGSSGGDNNQPGYAIDITGLKTLFTNTPYVVQLIASADSMQYLTNAFIIDATANTTQSVVYPSTPPVGDSGDTAWIRGIGGGLSTGSGSVNTDHLKIIGNRAAHGGDKVTGFNAGSTIAGFIITDKPVVSMDPQPVAACGHDTITLNPYAIGVPPLAYQWRKGGVAISGATGSSYSVTNVNASANGDYDVIVTNLYGKATSSVSTVTVDVISSTSGKNFVVDSNPANAEHDGYNFGASWQASNTDAGGTNRIGVMQFSAAASNQIAVLPASSFNSSTGTIAFWFRTAGVSDPGGQSASIFDRASGNIASGNGLIIVQTADGRIEVQASQGVQLLDSGVVADNKWHHCAVSYDQGAGANVALYIDGALVVQNGNALAWSWAASQQIELGFSHDQFWQPYNGLLDDVRVYNRILTAGEIASIHTSDALVDTAALQLRLNFDGAPGPGITLKWACPDAILQSADDVAGPYSDLGVSSPYPAAAHAAKKFFRYRGHVPASILSNPFLM